MKVGVAHVLFVAALWIVVVGVADRPAHAEHIGVRLNYDAIAACPDEDTFRDLVVARLSYDPFEKSAQEHVVVRMVRTSAQSGALDGRVEWHDSTGRWAGDQTLPGVTSDCLRLARAVAFAVAVQIQLRDPGAATRPRAPALSVEAAESPASAPPNVRPAATAPTSNIAPVVPTAKPIIAVRPPTSPQAPSPLFSVGAGPSLASGLSSTLVPFGRFFCSLAWRPVSIEFAAEASLPATVRRADGAGISQQELLLSAAGCVLRSRWDVCLLAKAGENRMFGRDVDLSTSAVVPVIQAGVRIGVVQSLGRRAFLSAHTDGVVLLSRWTGTLDRVPVWTSPRLAIAFGLDVGVRFPQEAQ